jgi:hypothetical protein
MASAHTLTAMVRQSKRESAAALARDDLAFVERVGSPICSEVMFRVAAAEALFEGGDRRSAERVLAGAIDQIELRAGTMSDAAMKDSYLTRRAENRRAFELARTFRESS